MVLEALSNDWRWSLLLCKVREHAALRDFKKVYSQNVGLFMYSSRVCKRTAS